MSMEQDTTTKIDLAKTTIQKLEEDVKSDRNELSKINRSIMEFESYEKLDEQQNRLVKDWRKQRDELEIEVAKKIDLINQEQLTLDKLEHHYRVEIIAKTENISDLPTNIQLYWRRIDANESQLRTLYKKISELQQSKNPPEKNTPEYHDQLERFISRCNSLERDNLQIKDRLALAENKLKEKDRNVFERLHLQRVIDIARREREDDSGRARSHAQTASTIIRPDSNTSSPASPGSLSPAAVKSAAVASSSGSAHQSATASPSSSPSAFACGFTPSRHYSCSRQKWFCQWISWSVVTSRFKSSSNSHQQGFCQWII